MNTTWLTLPKQRRLDIINQVTERTGLPAVAIEKDWWVTLALQAVFSLPYGDQFVFKGGTSLSKCWDLIQRFSEDIDLAIDRSFFGFEGDISKSQIKKLRKASCEFITIQLLADLQSKLEEWNAIQSCTLVAHPVTDSDKDPQTIEIQYESVVEDSGYLPQRVLIEISSRSLMEPSQSKPINSMIGDTFEDSEFATSLMEISTVLPQRTFLEKIFLLHEEFSLEPSKIRIERLSRHLYDLEKLMDTDFGKSALNDPTLFSSIVEHREKFNAIRGLDYSNHKVGSIRILPAEPVLKEYENDYRAMIDFMIYGDYLQFNDLIIRIKELESRINKIA